MKKILSGIVVSVCMMNASAQYQFPNSDFEENFISSYGSYQEPRGWHGYASIDASGLNSNGRKGDKLVQSTDVRPGATGQKCVFVKATSILGIVANGVMTNGQIYTHSTKATDGTQNYNFSQPDATLDAGTYGENNKFFTPFTGRPDAVRVWLKFAPAKSGTGNARVCMWLHSKGKMCDPTDNTDPGIIIAQAVSAVPASGWKEYEIPFNYMKKDNPSYILATFTTNETPGGGSSGDQLFIDDIRMVYSTALKATYNGNPIVFDAQGVANVSAPFNANLLSYTSGVSATFAQSVDENGTVTITVWGGDFSENPDNVKTYTIHFKGIASNSDDEPEIVVVPETTIEMQAPKEGRVYITNHNGKYLDWREQFTDNRCAWNVTRNGDSGLQFKNEYTEFTWADNGEGPYLYMERTASANEFDPKNFNTWSSYKAPSTFMARSCDDGGYVLYRYIQFYDGAWIFSSPKSDNIYLISTDDNRLTCGWVTHIMHGWYFYDASQVDRVKDFWPNYKNARENNGISADAFVIRDGRVNNLPLGLYSVTGNGTVYIDGKAHTSSNKKFYIPAGSEVRFAGKPSLTYYGRLNFNVAATYEGVPVVEGSVEATYQEDLLNIVADGNGVEDVDRLYNPQTGMLTIVVSGYGRSRETNIQFLVGEDPEPLPLVDLSGAVWSTIKNDGTDNSGGYMSIATDYIDADSNNALLLDNTTADDEETGLWTLAGNDEDGYRLYNKSLGNTKVLGITGANENARARMVDAALVPAGYKIFFDKIQNGAGWSLKIHGSDNNYLNNRDNYLALWNDSRGSADNGSRFVVVEIAPATYTITFDTDGGSAIDPITQESGTAVTAPANPTKTGHTFTGWDKEIPATMPAENMTVKALWTINKYNLVYKVDGEVYKTIEVEYGAAITPEEEPVKAGCIFSGWSEILATMPAENVEVTGSFEATSINSVDADAKANEKVYNIQGQRLAKSQKGLNIVDGKVMINR